MLVLGKIRVADGTAGIALGRLRVLVTSEKFVSVGADGQWVFEASPEIESIGVKVFDGEILLLDDVVAVRDGVAAVVLSEIPIADEPILPLTGYYPHRVISAESWQLLFKLGNALLESKLIEEVIFDQIVRTVYELVQLDQLAIEVTNGLPDASNKFIDFIAREWEWNWAHKPMRNPIEIDTCNLRLTRGVGPLLAAHLAGGEERGLLGQAATAYLRRAEPIYRVLRAAEAVSFGTVSLKEAGDLVYRATILLSPDYVGLPLDNLLGGGSLARDRLDPKQVRLPMEILPVPLPERPGLGAYLDPCNWEWLNCAEVFERAPNLPRVKLPPPGTVRVDPPAICASAATKTITLTLTGLVGAPDRGWAVSLGGTEGRIISWTEGQVVAEFDGPHAPKCYALYWLPNNGEFSDPFAGCEVFFGPSAWRVPIAYAGQMNIVGTPTIDYFTIGGQPGAAVALAGNSPMNVAWGVNLDLCDLALASVTLLRDGAPWKTGLTLEGQVLEAAPCSTTVYQLEVDVGDGQQSCSAIQSSTITVTPFQTLTLSAPADILAGGSVSARIRLSCPAPVGGVAISFRSDPPSAVTVPVTSIPAGDVETSVLLTAAQACGMAKLTATASGHTSATANLRLLAIPSITQVSGIGTAFQSCAPITGIRLTVGCITTSARVYLVAESGIRVLARVKRSGTPSSKDFAGPYTLEVGVPDGLSSGTYTIEVEDEGRKNTAIQTVKVNAAPRITTIPKFVEVMAACPPSIAELRITAIASDKVTATYRGMSYTANRPSSADECSNWTATIRIVLARVGSISVVPSLGMVNGSMTMVEARLLFPPNVHRAIVLKGNDSSGGKRSALVTIKVIGSGGEITPSNAGTLNHEAVRSFPISECTRMRFLVIREELRAERGTGIYPSMTYETTDYVGHPDAPPSEVLDV